VAVKQINGVCFECDFGLDTMVIQMYLGVYEAGTVAVMRRLLAPGDVFVDVGANVGYISAVGASLVGPEGQVHSFEPVPEYFIRLQKLAAMNPRYTIVANLAALGEREGTARLVMSTTSIGGSTMIPDLVPPDEMGKQIEVPVRRLDAYIRSTGMGPIALIKIDAEGFEYPVLKGLEGYLVDPQHRPVIIVECVPAAYPSIGVTLADFAAYMARFGYRARRLDDTRGRPLDITTLRSTSDVLFVPEAQHCCVTGY
jgi:FkbM family methyltransferase